MKELFDKELRNHIKDTYDHYDDLLADDGWKQFNKQQNRKKRGLVFWYTIPTGVAAALALIWLFNGIDYNSITDKKSQITQTAIKENISENNTDGKLENIDKEYSSKSYLNKDDKTALSQSSNTLANSGEKTKGKVYIPQEALLSNNQIENSRIAILPVSVQKDTIYQITFSSNNKADIVTPKLAQSTPENRFKNDTFLAKLNLEDISKPSLKELTPNKAVESKSKKSNFNLTFDANTYYNFTANQVNNQPNIGVGVLSEFRLSKKLSINTGIAINRQTTNFDGNQNSNNFKNVAASAPLTGNSSFNALPSALETSARLVGFDIPINLKLDFKVGKANTFITTGLSSYSLLNEKYVNQLSVVSYSLNGFANKNTITSVQNNPESSFNDFQFARTINFSFGVLYPISKTNSISLEPFMKYPLNGLGYQDLKIGSGGISFKLNFGK
ncbi:outer membrane beta-barrel protein [Pedobacter alpinus]|uniref:Outer membrane beta-barrel protein n=1 Tax=Pedobacter alpinus TaxID=1590643 RepID=A0ABW5TU95_9SPHI